MASLGNGAGTITADLLSRDLNRHPCNWDTFLIANLVSMAEIRSILLLRGPLYVRDSCIFTGNPTDSILRNPYNSSRYWGLVIRTDQYTGFLKEAGCISLSWWS